MPTSMISTGLNHASDKVDPALEVDGGVSSGLGTSTSPAAQSLSNSQSKSGASLSRTTTGTFAKQLKPFATEDIKILLLENVNKTGRDILTAQGYQVEALKSSLPEDELIHKIRWSRSLLVGYRKEGTNGLTATST